MNLGLIASHLELPKNRDTTIWSYKQSNTFVAPIAKFRFPPLVLAHVLSSLIPFSAFAQCPLSRICNQRSVSRRRSGHTRLGTPMSIHRKCILSQPTLQALGRILPRPSFSLSPLHRRRRRRPLKQRHPQRLRSGTIPVGSIWTIGLSPENLSITRRSNWTATRPSAKQERLPPRRKRWLVMTSLRLHHQRTNTLSACSFQQVYLAIEISIAYHAASIFRIHCTFYRNFDCTIPCQAPHSSVSADNMLTNGPRTYERSSKKKARHRLIGQRCRTGWF